MKKMSFSSLAILILLALMPFAALGGKNKVVTHYKCSGNKIKSEDKCREVCGNPPYSKLYGVCQWDWFSLWLRGSCVCYDDYYVKNIGWVPRID
ncbi:hypothetical protein ACP275_09G092700 [Erythranthe tilingii]